MSNAPGNPYDPPKTVEPKPVAGDGKMRYMYAYNYIFENPNWMTNVMYGFVCFIIPVVGPLLMLGYQFEITESLVRYPGRMYPNFDFSKFSYYLMRGIWPFLTNLICSLPIGFIIGIFYAVMFISVGLLTAAGGKDIGPILGGIAFLVELFVMTFISIFIGVVIQPFFLRAGLSQDFGQAFKVAWVKDYLKRVWKEALFFQIFMSLTAFPLALIGMALCCVGIYAAIAVLVLAQGNMLYQLYNLYLLRGGEAIPLKTPPPESSLATV